MATPHVQIEFDPADFGRLYERMPFFIRHTLADHPLFSIEQLIELARTLPSDLIEFNAGNVPRSLPQVKKPDVSLTAEETLRQIVDCKSWLGLKRIQLVPEYRALVDELLDQVQPFVERQYPGMYRREGFIFVTSPHSTVPFHMDPEHNFLLQIRGHKAFTAFDKTDRRVVTEEDLEFNYTQGHRRMELRPEIEALGHTFMLAPGMGLHVPISCPHHVENHSDVSVALSITFATPRADRRAAVYKVNRHLRRMGIQPMPYGASAWWDSIKGAVGLAYGAARQALRRHDVTLHNKPRYGET